MFENEVSRSELVGGGCGEKPHHLHGLEKAGQLVDACAALGAFAYYAGRAREQERVCESAKMTFESRSIGEWCARGRWQS